MVSSSIGNVGCFARDREQVGRPLALLPQRRALAGPAAGQQQRARRGLAEPGREQRRGRELADHELVDLVGVDEQLVERKLVDRLGQAQHDAVVAPHQLDRQAASARRGGPGAPSPTARAPARRTA